MLYITIAITGVVFVITQVLLFWFAYKYQYSEKRKAHYFPHNNKLEVDLDGGARDLPDGAGRFWAVLLVPDHRRSAGGCQSDRGNGQAIRLDLPLSGEGPIFGKKYYQNINDGANNQLGLIWDDPYSHDDIVTGGYVYRGQQTGQADHQFPGCDP